MHKDHSKNQLINIKQISFSLLKKSLIWVQLMNLLKTKMHLLKGKMNKKLNKFIKATNKLLKQWLEKSNNISIYWNKLKINIKMKLDNLKEKYKKIKMICSKSNKK